MRRHGAGSVKLNQKWSPWEKFNRSLHPDHDEQLDNQEIERGFSNFYFILFYFQSSSPHWHGTSEQVFRAPGGSMQ